MPRGVYDRSKLKKNNKTSSTETVSAAPAKKGPKGKPGRKPGKVSAQSSAKAVTATTKVSADALTLFSEVRQNLGVLSMIADKFGDIPAVKSEVAAHVELIGSLRGKVFGTEEKTEKVAAQVSTSNGATATTQYPSTVPMPPAPIPSIPTQS